MSSPTGDRQGAIEAYADAMFNGCAAALSTLLNHTITITREETLAPGRSLPEALPLPWFVAQARFTRGLAGGHDFVLPQPDGLALARLVLGEEPGEPGVVTTDHEDALREMVSQMLSSASSSLKGFFAKPVTLTLAELRRIGDSDAWMPGEATIALAQVLVDGVAQAKLALSVPPSVADDAVSALAVPAEASAAASAASGLEMILDISMSVTVELGRTKMLIRDILALGPGSVIELDKLAGEPVDLLVNERPIAKGEVVVIDDNFGVRLTQISQPTERLRSLT
jgi:flagellar motor switch protein FliN/FliY